MDSRPTETVRPERHHFLSVDFVTARTVAECQDCLLHCSSTTGQSLTLNEDGSFAIRRTVLASDKPDEIKFWGTLEPTRRGTWVWGTVIEATSPSRNRQVYALALSAVVLAFALVDGWLRGSDLLTVTAGLLLLAVGLLAARLWLGRHRNALQVVNWVYETLYVPPERE